MKTLPTLATGLLAILLVLGPTAAFAQSTVTVATDQATYSGSATITVSGTVSPPPTTATAVTVTIKNPSNALCDISSNAVSTTNGAYSHALVAGGNACAWTSGKYTVNATWGSGTGGATATAATSFTYTGTGTTGGGAGVIPYIYVAATSPVYAGQTVQIQAMLVWSNNGTLAAAQTLTATLRTPGGNSSSLGAPLASSTKGQYYWTTTLPANAANGAYFIQVLARASGAIGWGLGSFTVNSNVATAANQATEITALTNLQSTVVTLTGSLASGIASLTSALGTVQSAATSAATAAQGLTTTVNSIQSTVNSINSAVGSISSGLGQLNNLSSQISATNAAVQNSQTYVLVVAALAAITLVLELAILVRKLS